MYPHDAPTIFMFSFTKVYIVTNMLTNKSCYDIAIYLLRISNFLNLPITCCSEHALSQFSVSYLHLKLQVDSSRVIEGV